MPDSDISFLVHRGSRGAAFVEGFVSSIRATNPDWRIGAAIHLPRNRPPYQLGFARALAGSTSYVVADPETRLMHLPYGNRGGAHKYYDYLKESDPAGNRRSFTERALKSQIDNERTVLISPWLVHSLSGTSSELQATAAFAAHADAIARDQDRKLLLGFEATESIIAGRKTRNAFLNELVEAPERPIYLRLTAGARASSAQYAHLDALLGLRKVSESLADNGRALLLPQSGLAGWLMLGFGASAFGAGPQWSMQRSETLRAGGGGGGGGAEPLQWYFWPQFLGFVLAEEVAQLTQVAGAQTCGCPYCRATPLQAGPGFSREASEQHYLWWCASLAQEARRARDKEQLIRDRVAGAESFWAAAQKAGVVLDARSRPTHLATWSQVVA